MKLYNFLINCFDKWWQKLSSLLTERLRLSQAPGSLGERIDQMIKTKILFIVERTETSLNHLIGIVNDLGEIEWAQWKESLSLIVFGSWRTDNKLCVTALVLVTFLSSFLQHEFNGPLLMKLRKYVQDCCVSLGRDFSSHIREP